ncbi:NUDIX hydrolase [Streptomyces sp. NPDC059003]|uniref:NUDIX hydrolase n=1 Tax=Streptomyces sp. NPDC059003 TaxID=3346691 RepID=UPI0036CD8757
MAHTLNIIGVHLLFERIEQGQHSVLLGLRAPQSDYAPDTWHFPAGHCEFESVSQCAVRESQEELGIPLEPEHLDLVHTVHLLDPSSTQPRLGLVLRVRHWTGEPRLMEPDKCSQWAWWPMSALPEPIVPYTKAALEGIAAGTPLTELGWRPQPAALPHGPDPAAKES